MPSEPLEVETFNLMLNYIKLLGAIVLLLLGADHKNKHEN